MDGIYLNSGRALFPFQVVVLCVKDIQYSFLSLLFHFILCSLHPPLSSSIFLNLITPSSLFLLHGIGMAGDPPSHLFQTPFFTFITPFLAFPPSLICFFRPNTCTPILKNEHHIHAHHNKYNNYSLLAYSYSLIIIVPCHTT